MPVRCGGAFATLVSLLACMSRVVSSFSIWELSEIMGMYQRYTPRAGTGPGSQIAQTRLLLLATGSSIAIGLVAGAFFVGALESRGCIRTYVYEHGEVARSSAGGRTSVFFCALPKCCRPSASVFDFVLKQGFQIMRQQSREAA